MQTLRFTVNGEDLDMGNARVRYSRNNPMFEEVGSHTLPFKILRNLHNESILKSNNAAYISPVNKLDAVLHVGPIQLRGEFVKLKTNDLYYEGHFTTGNSTFREKVRDVKLNDLDYTEVITGSSSVSFTTALNSAAAGSFPTFNYTCFPMLAPNYFNGVAWSYNPVINPWTYNTVDPSLGGFYSSDLRSLTRLFAPSFYLCFVLEKMFDILGYTIVSNDIFNDTELRTLVIPNFNTLGEVDTTFKQYDLKFENSLPSIGINDFISHLEKAFNITFFISDISRTINIKKNPAIVKAAYSKKLKLISREQEYESIDGFSLDYQMESNDSFSNISSIDEYELGLTVDNVSDLSSYNASNYPNKLAFISNYDLYYLSILSDVSTDSWEWQVYTKDFFGYSEGNDELNISTGLNPVLADVDFIYYYEQPTTKEFAILPRADLSCINSSGLQEYKTFASLRLLFYRGIIDTGGLYSNPAIVDGQYPFATPDIYRPQGLTSPVRYGRVKISSANQSLRWGGQYGLYETHWKDYLYWYINLRKSATDLYDLAFEEIFGINFWEKYQAGDVSILFRSMELEFDFDTDTVTPGKCEVYLS